MQRNVALSKAESIYISLTFKMYFNFEFKFYVFLPFTVGPTANKLAEPSNLLYILVSSSLTDQYYIVHIA